MEATSMMVDEETTEEIECIVDALIPFIQSGYLPKEVELLEIKLTQPEQVCLRRRVPQVYPIGNIASSPATHLVVLAVY